MAAVCGSRQSAGARWWPDEEACTLRGFTGFDACFGNRTNHHITVFQMALLLGKTPEGTEKGPLGPFSCWFLTCLYRFFVFGFSVYCIVTVRNFNKTLILRSF